MTPKEQEWICEIAALNSASNTVTIAKICWKEIRRLRISQLRRMTEIALGLARRWAKSLDAMDPNDAAQIARNAARYRRFAAACLAEIKSLRRVA